VPVLPFPRSTFERYKKLLAPDFDERAAAVRDHYARAGGDPFGFDYDFAEKALLVTGLFYRTYFRVDMTGLENIPEGGALLVANHSGQIPLDGVMIGTGLLLDAPEPRLIRSMFDRWASTLPWVSVFLQRVGQVVGRPENFDRLLEGGELILVFPEGTKGIQKTFKKAYQLEEFGLGFMRLSLQHGCPIVPVAVVGAEEQYPAVYDARWLGRRVGLESMPIPLQMLLPFIGFMPLPTKYHIRVGAPLRFDGDPDDEDQVIGEKVWVVRHTIQLLLEKLLKERGHVFW
jgi:1-acyl-sn-glycerol-3-phosphate acyltransferase